jgi:hypothetical protein
MKKQLFFNSRFSHVLNPELVSRTKRLAAEERRITAEVIEHLREISERMIHLESYRSLSEFCQKELGYSEDQAQARVSAMKVSRVVPEVIKKVESGKLSLTNLVSANAFFNRESKEGKPLALEQKREILLELEGKSTRECQRMLGDLSPGALPWDRERILSTSHTQITFAADQKLMEDLEKIRGLWGNQGHLSYSELLQKMAEVVLKKIDPMQRPNRQRSDEQRATERRPSEQKTIRQKPTQQRPSEQKVIQQKPTQQRPSEQTPIKKASESDHSSAAPRRDEATRSDDRQGPGRGQGAAQDSLQSGGELVPPPEFVTPEARNIPEPTKREVWLRDQGRCTHSYANGGRCDSRFALQFDHIIPWAYGGTHEADNLRLLCRAHHALRSRNALRDPA